MKPLFDHASAIAHITAAEPKLGAWIPKLRPYATVPKRVENLFEHLLESIVYQQLHAKAAASIHGRVLELLPQRRPTPHAILQATPEALRAAGLSQAKMLAAHDLAAKALDGTVPTIAEALALEDEELIERLTAVRGIGRWTVQMVLLFDLGRPDVWPTGDFGVRSGFQKLYRKRRPPLPREMEQFAARWRPFRSVAAWYFWRVHELGELEGKTHAAPRE